VALCEIAIAVSGDIVSILLFGFGGGGVTYVTGPAVSDQLNPDPSLRAGHKSLVTMTGLW